ncbi:cytidine and dCMP deaminase domain-containing protein 1 isoform X2 [Phyllopteryx taeniolatus]|uniref:cytidine and dCMP deaminase domain-containing protein 1 isoform X2 n=1 Tax=Phyllopteryx taeniolatus TaxID=161469 RepID=UPI002AD379E4|nr:cytidine and dCMP deaminase domain-containing protein 1 isoform X2 [Phyllopteryx taeniolatus]XP_061655543.1 cytidine and dCMP deaminase domain-containing protein 1 isoform X2 [Phyllopteryx taeniolatus]XP_061655551.1 cytidine and dCMP deaminase domain-containing protein 1 isoform X2 [Phyllopteryx taeniolatus]XP_061655561.1 cytidine and dCMP deaminase domain-containing protein 1 isoform X2 [Phyllopteryx taeniolatus]XP_061655571.1 cytidine and dCMP deaminase domain-containing protein 1 isoform 
MEDSRRETRPLTADFSSQTISVVQGHGPRLSKINLITLLSLWLELFPQEQPEEDDNQIRSVGLVVVRDSKVVGLHYSGHELHAGQAAIIQHAARLADCQLYFSRRPCATCLKMIINAGVSQISFWPGDPEFSMLSSDPHAHTGHITEEAALDALATEKLKSNSSSHICLLLQPLAAGMVQFVGETSRECDFMGMATDNNPGLNTEELFCREQEKHLEDLSKRFLIEDSRQHREILTQMHLENFCVEPYFSNLRHNMREVVKVLAAVVAGVPEQHYGFHRETLAPDTLLTGSSPCPYHEGVSQEIARHCIIQARLLAYRTEDPKVGVGAVIWANKQLTGLKGPGHLSLVGCGYNAYPAGSQYAEYPLMDTKQEDRKRRKYRYIVHAEQNALTFRTRDINPEEAAMLFVTKCPCDECVPLIRGAGITHIYTTDHDRDKNKGDISYLRFSNLKEIQKFIWQRDPASSSYNITNGHTGKRSRAEVQENPSIKKICNSRNNNLPPVS